MSDPIIIEGPFGPTTEWARRDAAEILKGDPVKREMVLDLLTSKMGSREAAEAEIRRRYPEAFDEPASA